MCICEQKQRHQTRAYEKSEVSSVIPLCRLCLLLGKIRYDKGMQLDGAGHDVGGAVAATENEKEVNKEATIQFVAISA